DSLTLIHRAWRSPKYDYMYPGREMYRIHVILYGPHSALNRVKHVKYRLNPRYPKPTQFTTNRLENFGLNELAFGPALIRAEVKIKGQKQPVLLSRYIDLTETSEKLLGTRYLRRPPQPSGSPTPA